MAVTTPTTTTKVPWGRWLARRFGSFVLLVGAMLYVNRTLAPGPLLVLADMACYLAWFLTSFALRAGDSR